MVYKKSTIKLLLNLYHRKNKEPLNRDKISSLQLKIIDNIMKSVNTDQIILRELVRHSQSEDLYRKLRRRPQKRIFIESMQTEIVQIKECLHLVYDSIKNNQSSKEKKELMKLQYLIHEEKGTRKQVKENLERVMELEHSEWFIGLLNRYATYRITKRCNIIVTGLENIPRSGPVMLAPRHYDWGYDNYVLMHVIPRKIFFLGATDFLESKWKLKIWKFFLKKMGTVPVHRPDAPMKKVTTRMRDTINGIVRLLLLGQAVLIYPEGWPVVDVQHRPGDEGLETDIRKISFGVFHFVLYAQKRINRLIPIVPIGLSYKYSNDLKDTVFVRIGKGFYLRDNNLDFYALKLRKEIARLSDTKIKKL